MKIIKTRVMVMLILSINLAGCVQPMAYYNNRLYLGIYNREKINYTGGEYNKLKGVGLSIGCFAIGLGYYDMQQLTVDKQIASIIDSPMAKVWISHDPELTDILTGKGGINELR